MKELSIKEKAKRYDEAIKVAKGNYETIMQMDNDCTFAKEGIVNTFHHIFPELKDSEDERIRKALKQYFINSFQNNGVAAICGVHIKDVLAWLEKQGGNNMGISEATKQKLEDSLNKALEKETPESCNEFLEKQGEQKPAWSEEDEEMYAATIFALAGFIGNEDVLDWLKNLKERVSREVNCTTTKEWSEEDEKMLKACTELVGSTICANYGEEDGVTIESCRNWLKFLKERYTWKPSEEQIKALSYYLKNDIDNDGVFGCQLVKLYQDLKKLREE